MPQQVVAARHQGIDQAEFLWPRGPFAGKDPW